MRPTRPTDRPGEAAPVVAAPIRPGEERTFHAIYRRHPGVPRLFGRSREALEEAARGPSARGYLLARAGGSPVGALALQREPGRRTATWFPIARTRSARAEICSALGAAAREWAAAQGSVRLECEFRVNPSAERLEPGLGDLGLRRVTDRLLLQRPLDRGDLSGEPALLSAAAEADAMELLESIYVSSDDPAVASIPAADDVALFGAAAQPPSQLVVMIPVEEAVPVGLCFLRVQGGVGEIVFIGVSPHFRRRGHGRRLLHACLIRLRQLGAHRAALAVSEENRPARELYREFGFRSAGRARLYRSAL